MKTPEITIGVPVHNGAAQLEDCLRCLQQQSFEDFQVLIFENHSTDESPQIAQRFVDQDPRFTMMPSDTFLSASENFQRALRTIGGKSKYFMLRAHDDYTDQTFLERLYDALESDPSKDLTVFDVTYHGFGRTWHPKFKTNIFEAKYYTTFFRPFLHLAFPASWYYGLYRGQASAESLLSTIRDFPSFWGGDMLAINYFIVQDKAVYVPGAMFHCDASSDSEAIYTDMPVSEKWKLRMLYRRLLFQFRTAQPRRGPIATAAFFVLCARCARKHTGYKTRKLVKQWFKERFATKG